MERWLIWSIAYSWIIKHKGTFDFEEEITFPSEMFEKYAHINGLKRMSSFQVPGILIQEINDYMLI